MSNQTYQCSAGETFDLAALRIYGDEQYASALLAANPSLVHKLEFDGGERLSIPAIDIQEDEDGNPIAPPPWKT